MNDVRVLHRDITAIRFCNRGARSFFLRHGLDWNDFVKNGIPISTLELIDDEMARQAILQAKKREHIA